MTVILKRKDFARWQSGEKLSDAALCKAVQEMESGLIDADLGGSSTRSGWPAPVVVKRRLPHTGIGRDRQPLRVPAWVPEERQGEHHAGREEGAAIRRQSVLATVRGNVIEGVAVGRVIGGAL